MLSQLYLQLAEIKGPSIWMPTSATSENQVDGLLFFILWVTGFFIVFNAGLMVFFAIRYRQRSKQGASHGHTHNTAMELTWSILPAFILAIIFIWGFRGYMVMATPPANAYDIMVTGKKWVWDFQYPNGEYAPLDDATGMASLHVPAGQPVRLTLQSVDVLHSVFIPAMRVKKDVVPGRYNQLWFTAEFDAANAETIQVPTLEGDLVDVRVNIYDLFCTEYCGTDHSKMITKMYVYEQEDYDKWYVSMSIVPPSTPLVEHGKRLYSQCSTCHSLDGSAGTGPSWKDLYGATGHATSAGSLDVNDEYIYESIRNPGAKLADGYPNVMGAFASLSDRDIRAIIEYMKTISVHAEADADLTYGGLNPDGTLKSAEAEGEGDVEAETEGGEGEEAPAED